MKKTIPSSLEASQAATPTGEGGEEVLPDQSVEAASVRAEDSNVSAEQVIESRDTSGTTMENAHADITHQSHASEAQGQKQTDTSNEATTSSDSPVTTETLVEQSSDVKFENGSVEHNDKVQEFLDDLPGGLAVNLLAAILFVLLCLLATKFWKKLNRPLNKIKDLFKELRRRVFPNCRKRKIALNSDEIGRRKIVHSCDFQNETVTEEEIVAEIESSRSIVLDRKLKTCSFDVRCFLEQEDDSLLKQKIAAEIYKNHENRNNPRVDVIYIISNSSHNLPFIGKKVEEKLKHNRNHVIKREIFTAYDLGSDKFRDYKNTNFIIIQTNTDNDEWLPKLVQEINSYESNEILGIYTIFDSLHASREVIQKPVAERVLVKLNL